MCLYMTGLDFRDVEFLIRSAWKETRSRFLSRVTIQEDTISTIQVFVDCLDPEDEDATIIRNDGNHPPRDTASRPKRLESQTQL
jgi:hypothetical protein